MFVLSNRLLKVPVMSIQTGSSIALTAEPIIDPRKLQIVAFFCEGGKLSEESNILHTSDIREVSDIGFIVNSSDDIMDGDGLVRLQEIVDYNFRLIGIPVYEDRGGRLGVVGDYIVDTASFFISKLHVKRPLLKSFSTSELVIDRTQIIEVTNKRIVVRSATVKDEQVEAATTSPIAFENPFRKPQPSPDTATTNPRRPSTRA